MRNVQGYVSFKMLLALLLAFVVALIAAFILSSPLNPIFSLNKFDQNKWLEDVNAGKENNNLECQRGKMTQDLIDRVLTTKLSKTDVLNLLGEPTITSKNSLQYTIGWCGFNSDNSIYIEFNSEANAKPDGEYLQKAYLLKR